MLRRGQIDFLNDSVLTVSRPVTSEDSYHNPPAVAEDNAGSGAIQLSNIPQGTTEDTLYMFLESKRRCDGGPIKSLEYDASRQTATVTFKDSQSELCISVCRSERTKSHSTRMSCNIWNIAFDFI